MRANGDCDSIPEKEYPEEQSNSDREDWERVILEIEGEFLLIGWTDILRMKHYKESTERKEYKWKDIIVEEFYIKFMGSREYHLHRNKEDNEESHPLDLWVFIQVLGNQIRGKCHEDYGEHEPDSKCCDILMSRSGNCEDIIETHGEIRYDNRPYSCHKPCLFGIDMMFFTIWHTEFSIEFPHDIEKEDSSCELYSHKREEKYRKKCENNTENGCQGDSEENSFFSLCPLEFPGRHPDQNRIVPTHHDIDEDDIQKCQCTMSRKEVQKLREEKFHKKRLQNRMDVSIVKKYTKSKVSKVPKVKKMKKHKSEINDRFVEYFRENFFTDKPEELEKFLESLTKPLPKTIRVNTNRISVEDFRARAKQNNWILTPTNNPTVFRIDRTEIRLPLGHTLKHLLGYFYIQELSASMSVHYLAEKTPEKLDLRVQDSASSFTVPSHTAHSGAHLSHESLRF